MLDYQRVYPQKSDMKGWGLRKNWILFTHNNFALAQSHQSEPLLSLQQRCGMRLQDMTSAFLSARWSSLELSLWFSLIGWISRFCKQPSNIDQIISNHCKISKIIQPEDHHHHHHRHRHRHRLSFLPSLQRLHPQPQTAPVQRPGSHKPRRAQTPPHPKHRRNLGRLA